MFQMLMLAVGVAVHAPQPAQGAPDPVTVYAPVIEHVRATKPAWPGLRIALDTRINDRFGPQGRPPARSHPATLLQRLQEGGWLDGICSLGSTHPCAADDDVAVLRLGPIVMLGDSAPRAEDAVISVDVVLTTPCPAPPESERCRVPDLVEYRYLLRAEPGGTYRVVSRHMIGAI